MKQNENPVDIFLKSALIMEEIENKFCDYLDMNEKQKDFFLPSWRGVIIYKEKLNVYRNLDKCMYEKYLYPYHASVRFCENWTKKTRDELMELWRKAIEETELWSKSNEN